MKLHITHEDNPRNSYETVLEVVERNKLEPKHGEAELLSEFIKLLGKEKEEWGGVKAMTVCVEEYRLQEPNGDEGSMTSKAVIEANRETRKVRFKEPDHPSSSKAVKQDLPKASGSLKEPDHPSSSKAVKQDLPKASGSLKGTDDPSTNIAIIQATNKKILKVKIYMGTGWDTDFPKLHRGSSPDLFVNLMIHGGKIRKTVHKRSWTPSWGKEFEFPLSSLENDELVVEVYDHTLIFKDKLAGTFRHRVSKLQPGIQAIPLSDEVGKQARLLMRFMFV
ncbi:phosphoinositide phospholipase C 1 isoform X4 [Brassica rapa]|uniref:phosphoinositide phospholipase C 1 isoform X4 n=1 Tax=Brassica campestris TaxID=3711 RepID=UPI0004F189A0|nr:phosphoinositide phospholipase C 1 isoform X4 [Brassica rapa]XP_013748944.2 phosphoinositide phospholipase C 1 isoform X3 [Brassica napus]